MKAYFQKIIPTLLFFLLFTGCGERITPGQYKVMGVKLTPEITATEVKSIFDSMPVFTFLKGRKVNIKPDFSFGYFRDSLFTYKLKDGYLYLKSKNSEHKIMCEPHTESEKPSFELYLDTKCIMQIQIIKEYEDQ